MSVTSSVQYKSMDPLTHILHRPDMYIGSIKLSNETMYVADPETYRISSREITYNPGLLRIFVEALSNCIDNKWRSEENNVKMTKITSNFFCLKKSSNLLRNKFFFKVHQRQ